MERSQRAVDRRAVLSGFFGAALLLALPSRAAADMEAGERRLTLENPHTGETFSDVYWCDGAYVPEALRRVDWVMRDFRCDEATGIDLALVELLHRLSATLEIDRPVQILSGYRTRKTNRLLRGEGLHPAAHSLHLVGQAADIRIEKVPLGRLHRAAVSLRGGGVGTYRRSQFIHVDCGPVREWRDGSGRHA